MTQRHQGARSAAQRVWALLTLGCLLAGCGTAMPGYAARQTPDTGGLNVGNYPVTQRVIGNAGDERRGRVREGQRLAEYVLHGFEIDPRFSHPNWATMKPHVILDRRALSDWIANDTFDEIARDVITGYGTGYGTANDQAKSTVLINAAILFSSEQAAAQVAEALERDNFTYEKGSQHIAVPGQPRARAHWGTRAAGVSAWMPHGRFVLIVLVRDYTQPIGLAPAQSAAVLAGRTLAAQVPLLEKFVPTPADKLAQLPLDQGAMLGHSMPVDPDKPFRADEDSVLGPRGMLNEFDDPVDARAGLVAAGVDLAAFADGATFRARDEAAATTLFANWIGKDTDPAVAPVLRRKVVPSPPGMADTAKCTGPDKPDGSRSGIYLCAIRHGRYLAQVVSNHIQDVYQRAAAQYVLLGDW